jgi:hypothetical protein
MNTTTREGFLMNTSRRIPRQLVKALAAGAVVLAAALPMAFASAASAATAPSLTGASVTYNLTADGGNGTETAATSFGSGASGEILITGATGLAYDGGSASLTSTAAGLTFTSVTETSATTLTAAFASTSSTAPGVYGLSVTDDNGASASTAGLITVNAAPTLAATTPVVPATLSDGAGAAAAATVITGTGFGTAPKVTFTNTTDNTTLVSGLSGAGAGSAAANLTTDATPPGGATGESVNVAGSTTTALDVFVDPNNDFNASLAIPGAYAITITNPDGGTFTSGPIYTVTAYGITNLTPSALPDSATLIDTTVTIAGAGFQSSAVVSITACTGVTFNPAVIASTVTSATSITATIAYSTTGSPTVRCTVTVTNPSVANGGNAAAFTLPNALGFGESSGVAATVTATSATTPIAPGAATSAITFTGTGFSQYSLVTVYAGTSGTVATGVTINDCTGNTGTSLVCEVTVAATGAAAGADDIVVTNNAVASGPLAAGVSVAGPVITSMTPAAVAVGAPVGTTITLTGTGFTNTTTGSVTDNGVAGLNGLFSFVSATSMTLVLTASPVALNATTPADVPVVVLSQTVAAGVTVTSAPFDIAVDAAPTITGPVTYAAGTGVGVGATAQTIYIHGTGFATGVTVGSFVSGSAVADPNVTATVVSVNSAGTQITATVAIKAGDTNIADGYSVTNTDGGVAKATGILDPLVINVGPTVTGVTPATATPSGTTAFTIAGTNFEAGVVVAASSDGTCGTATVVSATSLTVSCTLGAASATPVTLIVTNVDGGSAISAAVLASAAPPAPKGPHATHVNGSAVTGKTVTITITGSGFTGAPKVTSNAAGTTAKVTHDTGKLLTVRISTKAGKGEHTLTIRDSDGKSCKINYATKA